MQEHFQTLRIRRNYLTIVVFLAMFIACGYCLLLTIDARGSIAQVFLLGLGTLAGFFLSLLSFASPYLRVDDDRIVVQHDLLRKDVLFFYDVHSIHFDDQKAIHIKHLNGSTRVPYRKFNAHDRKRVMAFFQALHEEKTKA